MAAGRPPTLARSLHCVLGGGAVADVVLWRKPQATALTAAGATSAWLLFERLGYSPLSLAANALLLLVVILFSWAKSAALLNRPLPPVPNLEVSNESIAKFASKSQVWINWILRIAHDIAIRKDRALFLQVILILWLVSNVGSLFNFLTLIYIGVMLSLAIPRCMKSTKVVLMRSLLWCIAYCATSCKCSELDKTTKGKESN